MRIQEERVAAIVDEETTKLSFFFQRASKNTAQIGARAWRQGHHLRQEGVCDELERGELGHRGERN
jgi:hypothetical protein